MPKSLTQPKLAKRGFEHYMETEQVDNPEYAYMNDTEVIAGAAIGAEWNDETNTVVWQEFSGKALEDFLNGTAPYTCPREKWQPAISLWLTDSLSNIQCRRG